jgi:hypothetical protein
MTDRSMIASLPHPVKPAVVMMGWALKSHSHASECGYTSRREVGFILQAVMVMRKLRGAYSHTLYGLQYSRFWRSQFRLYDIVSMLQQQAKFDRAGKHLVRYLCTAVL